MSEGLRITVGIGDPGTNPDLTETVFESTDSSGQPVIPLESLMQALPDSPSDREGQNLLIRASVSGSDEEPNTLLAADNRVELDRQRRSISVDEHLVDDLTVCEFDMLEFLMLNLDIVKERADIYQTVWRQSFRPDDRTVDVYVNKLRKKIGVVSEELGDREQGAIRSRFGIGYFVVSTLQSS